MLGTRNDTQFDELVPIGFSDAVKANCNYKAILVALCLNEKNNQEILNFILQNIIGSDEVREIQGRNI